MTSPHQIPQISHAVCVVIGCALPMISDPGPAHAQAGPMGAWPAGGTFVTDGKAEGIDPRFLENIGARMEQLHPRARSLLIVRSGNLVAERYFGEAKADQPYTVASVTKSVTSMLFGIAVAKGHVPGTQLTVGEAFPREAASIADAEKARITFGHLLSMTAGFKWHDRGDGFWRWRHSRNRTVAALQLPLVSPPGKVFTYNTAVSHLIGRSIALGTGQSLLDFANTHLFKPMGEQVTIWRRDPMGYYSGGSGLYMTPRQMAKFGLLLLNRGRWGERQIIPGAWVREATKPRVRFSKTSGYGYQTWLREFAGCAGYYALGRGGQHIVVVPDKQLVIVITAKFLAQSIDTAKYLPVLDEIVAATGATCPGGGMYRAGDAIHAHAPSSIAPLSAPKMAQDVDEFFRSFGAASERGDLEAVMALYSDRFYFDGADKAERAQFWKRVLPGIRSFSFKPIEVSQQDGGIQYSGDVFIDGRLYPAKGFLIREEGRWVALGNPKGRPVGVDLPRDLNAFMRSFASTLSQGATNVLPQYFSDQYLSNGFSKQQLLTWLSPIVARMGRTNFVISKFDRNKNTVRIDGVMTMAGFGEVPLVNLFGHLIYDDGEWLWYGNQSAE